MTRGVRTRRATKPRCSRSISGRAGSESQWAIPLLRVARPLTTIAREANAARFAAIAALIDEWQPDVLVVGLPVHADGAPHEMTARAERFARQLEGRFGLQVARVDERYTTEDAEATLAAAGVRARERKAVRDEVAAQLILQAWFDDPARNDPCGPA